MQVRPDGIARRCDLNLQAPAELAIGEAMRAVESAGCHPLLTEAVILLGQAKNKVADFVELPDARAYPAKYRKRPIIVEAVRFDPVGLHAKALPKGVTRSRDDAGNYDCGNTFYVTTIQGVKVSVAAGEYVITEADGIHHYPCSAEEFERIYEPLADVEGDPS